MSALDPPHVPRVVVLGLCIAALLVLVPFWTPLVLSIWIGHSLRRMVPGLTRLTGRKARAAAVLTVALVSVILVPLGLVAISLIGDAIDLAKRLATTPELKTMFEKLVTDGAQSTGTGGEAPAPNPMQLVMKHGDRAWSVLSMVFAVATKVIIGLFIFISSVYVVLSDGPAAYHWLERHSPLEQRTLKRFANAFIETGHGLFIGVGGAGLAQSIVATIAYIVIGVPEPFVLGLLTLAASVVPSIGTAFVWVPVAIGLALTGRTDAAIGLGIIGVAVIGSIDNLVRPFLAKWGKLDLPAFLIMISMFGGLALVGAPGIILGPLLLRLAKEAIDIAHDEKHGVAPNLPG
ncbi:MAG TPA: AI-2E family transporter [Kofleriaceae bacterium]|nr:AI-2E family transporter [Kofleriaceae bacterium]